MFISVPAMPEPALVILELTGSLDGVAPYHTFCPCGMRPLFDQLSMSSGDVIDGLPNRLLHNRLH